MSRTSGNIAVEANNLGNLAIVSSALGRVEEAATSYGALIPLFRRTGSRDGEAHATSNLAEVSCRLGRYDDAVRHGTRAAHLFHEIGDAQEAAALSHVASAHCYLGDFEAATLLAREALVISVRANHRYLEIDCLGVLAQAVRGGGDLPGALGHASNLLRHAIELDSPDALGRAHGEMAEVLLALRRIAEAESHATIALGLARASNFRMNAAEALIVLAEAAEARDDARTAAEHAREAYDIGRKAGLALVTDRAYRLLERCASPS